MPVTKHPTHKITVALLPPADWHVAKPDWIVGPVGQHRESDTVEESNFSVLADAMDALDPNGADWEILHFKHWAVGWIEEMATRPGSKCNELAEEMRARLAEYPILDEDAHSALEMEKEPSPVTTDEFPDCEDSIYAHV